MRVRSRLRASAIGTVQALTMALALTATSLALMSMHWRSGSALAVLALAIIAARTAWQTTHAAAVFDRALAQVVEAAGMIAPPEDRPGPAEADAVAAAARGPRRGIRPRRGA